MERTFSEIIKKPTATGTVRITIPKGIVQVLGLEEGKEVIVTVKV
jgi:bifunctional DNA-binding transcriptional regulator/antitoxin component of YhaV-PrlF toxin-antitoxin module